MSAWSGQVTIWDGLGGGGGAVDSVNAQTGVVVLSASDVGAQAADADLTTYAGITPTAVGQALLAAVNAAAARTAAGAQAADADLDTYAGISPSALGQALLAAANAAAARTAIGAQASDADLDSLATVTPGAAGLAILALAGAGNVRTYLSLVPGTDVQAQDAGLASLVGIDTAADLLPYTVAANAWAGTSLTAFARTVLDDTTQGAWQTTLGLGTGDSPTFTALTLSAAPTASTHAARLADVAGIAVKASVRLATAAALPACTAAGAGPGKTLTANANGALTVDSVAVANGDRLLVKDQATGANNGIYAVTDLGGAGTPFILTRTGDFDVAAEAAPNSTVWVAEGTALGDSQWTLTTNAPITVDTTALVWTQTSGLGQVSATAPVVRTGNVISITAATTAAAGVVELATDGESAANVVVQGNDARLAAALDALELNCLSL